MPIPDVEAEITLLSTVEGGRQTAASSGYRPQHKIGDDCLTSGTHKYFDCEQVLPGQTVRGTIAFLKPDAYPHSLWVGRVIDIQEGNRIIGSARITKILNPHLEVT